MIWKKSPLNKIYFDQKFVAKACYCREILTFDSVPEISKILINIFIKESVSGKNYKQDF